MLKLYDATKLAKQVRVAFSNLEKKTASREWNALDLCAGLSVDCGDLLRLVMAKEGLRTVEDVDEKLEHELCDVLWSVLILADRYGVDLNEAFPRQMHSLEQRIKKVTTL